VEAADAMGRALVQRGLSMVYGGGALGTMGRVARAMVAAGGDVIGVIPAPLADKEVALTTLSDLRVVDTMHERKAIMADLADAFVALPGGFGTIEEIFEAITWGQLDLHAKPCGLLDVDGYFGHLQVFLDHGRDHGFITPEHRSMVLVSDNHNALLDLLEAYEPPRVDKAAWARRIDLPG